jgi:hypothetical protein
VAIWRALVATLAIRLYFIQLVDIIMSVTDRHVIHVEGHVDISPLVDARQGHLSDSFINFTYTNTLNIKSNSLIQYHTPQIQCQETMIEFVFPVGIETQLVPFVTAEIAACLTIAMSSVSEAIGQLIREGAGSFVRHVSRDAMMCSEAVNGMNY